jgi:hypothetical protein
MKTQTFEVSQLQDVMLQNGFTNIKLYAQNGDLRFIETITKYYRKPLMIVVPNTTTIKIHSRDISITETHNDYRNKVQRDFLESIPMEQVLCKTDKNITIKQNKTFTHFSIEEDMEDEDSSVGTDISENTGEDNENESELSIEIEEYAVDLVLGYWLLPNFLKNISRFETEYVLPAYNTIFRCEEMSNERRVEHLIDTFEKQKLVLKDKITKIHEKIYNIHQDIEEHSKKLERLYNLQQQASSDKDRKRYKINRLILEVQSMIDTCHEQIQKQRILSEKLIQQYFNYLQKFK